MKEKGTLKTDNGSLLKKLLRDFGWAIVLCLI